MELGRRGRQLPRRHGFGVHQTGGQAQSGAPVVPSGFATARRYPGEELRALDVKSLWSSSRIIFEKSLKQPEPTKTCFHSDRVQLGVPIAHRNQVLARLAPHAPRTWAGGGPAASGPRAP